MLDLYPGYSLVWFWVVHFQPIKYIFRLWMMITLALMTKCLTQTPYTAWFDLGWLTINPSRICMCAMYTVHTRNRMIPWKTIFINYDSVTQCLTHTRDTAWFDRGWSTFNCSIISLTLTHSFPHQDHPTFIRNFWPDYWLRSSQILLILSLPIYLPPNSLHIKTWLNL